MTVNTQLSPQEMNELNYRVDGFNKKLKEDQKIVSKSTLEEADFMKLLITQLKTQDPTKPLEDKEFIGQMAQFTSLKQMNNLTDNMKNLTKEFAFSKAVGLVNKNVVWQDELGNVSSGTVESIKIREGNTSLSINGTDVTLEQIQQVSNPQVSNAEQFSMLKENQKIEMKEEQIDAAINASVLDPYMESYDANSSIQRGREVPILE
jgi:flagellar basal-body rod modification protein FlgD